MKKSRIAKFALLGASAAALAATLSTSTYAWYVTNKVANVNNGSAATGAAGSDGSILLSWTGNENKWFTSLDLTADTDKVVTYDSTTGLQPVHYDTNGFYGIASDGTKGAASTAYFSFTVKIKSLQGTGKQTVVTPTFTFRNYGGDSTFNTPTAPAKLQQCLTTTGAPTGVTQNQEFYVDALNSMYVQQVITDGTTSYSPANAQSCTAPTTVPNTAKTGGNAHSYYTAITSYTPWANDTNWQSGGLSTITVIESTVYTITYNIFLDGGDTDCFNSAAGQSFKFELAFTAADPTAYPGV